MVNFSWRFSAQYLAGVMIHPVGQLVYFGLADLCKIRSLGKPSSNHAVMYFVRSFLPGGIAVAIVDLSSMEKLS